MVRLHPATLLDQSPAQSPRDPAMHDRRAELLEHIKFLLCVLIALMVLAVFLIVLRL